MSSQKNELDSEPTEQGEGRPEKGKIGGRADLKMKAKIRTWSDVVKGLEEEESETFDLV